MPRLHSPVDLSSIPGADRHSQLTFLGKKSLSSPVLSRPLEKCLDIVFQALYNHQPISY